MKRVIKCESNTSYKDYWAYKEVSRNWKSDIKTSGEITDIFIWYDKKANDLYAHFQIKHVHMDDSKWGDFYMVYLIDSDGDKSNITESLDFTGDLNECIESCFYYFSTRF